MKTHLLCITGYDQYQTKIRILNAKKNGQMAGVLMGNAFLNVVSCIYSCLHGPKNYSYECMCDSKTWSWADSIDSLALQHLNSVQSTYTQVTLVFHLNFLHWQLMPCDLPLPQYLCPKNVTEDCLYLNIFTPLNADVRKQDLGNLCCNHGYVHATITIDKGFNFVRKTQNIICSKIHLF